MNKLKLLLISLSIFTFGAVLFNQTVLAADVFGICSSQEGGEAQYTDVCKDVNGQTTKTDPIITLMKVVINILSIAIGIISVIMIMIGGLRMILGGSDPQTINNSRNSIIYALVGILIAVLAQALVLFVLDNIT